jgi:hypothetical protein
MSSGLVPKDNAFNNLRSNNIIVRDVISAPQIITQQLVVRETTTETSGNTFKLHGTSNQITFGRENETNTIFNVDTTQSHTITFPASALNSEVVLTEGDQTINGLKTFTNLVVSGLSLSSLALSSTSNQLTLGTGNTITLSAPTPFTSRVYTLPDVANADFVMTQGTQTINGAKTLSDATTFGTSITLPTSGGTPTALSFYEVFTSTMDFTCSAFSGTQTVSYSVARIGQMCTLVMNGFTRTADGTGSSAIATSGAGIPARFRPLSVNIDYAGIRVITGGVFQAGNAILLTTGIFSILNSPTLPGQFTNDGLAMGFRRFTMSWNIA